MNSDGIYERWKERPYALSQSTHNAINARHYPGTRQMCVICDEPTGRTSGEDDMWVGDKGPLCETHYHELEAQP